MSLGSLIARLKGHRGVEGELNAIAASLERLVTLLEEGDGVEMEKSEEWVGAFNDDEQRALEERRDAYTARTGITLPEGEPPPSPPQ